MNSAIYFCADKYSIYQEILQDHSLQEILEQGIWELMKDDGKII